MSIADHNREERAESAVVTSDLEVFERAMRDSALSPDAPGRPSIARLVGTALDTLFAHYTGACPDCRSCQHVTSQVPPEQERASTTVMQHCGACDSRWPLLAGDDRVWW